MRYILCVIFGLRALSLVCQVDTVVQLIPVEVRDLAIRPGDVASIHIDYVDSTLAASGQLNVASWLGSENLGYIKSYGFGGLATLSARGLASGHSLLVWNGLPVESPMLGQMDLSLFPIPLMDNATMFLGGHSSQWGSGAIGSLLSFQNEIKFNQPFNLNLSATFGSFDRYTQSLGIKYGNRKWSTHTRFFHHSSVNNFEYEVAKGQVLNQQNAKVEIKGVNQSVGLKINDRSELALHYWGQTSRRYIPPTIRQNESLAFQDDESHRLAANYSYLGNRYVIQINAGYFRESLNYNDPLAGLFSESEFQNVLLDVGLRYQFGKRLTASWAINTNYIEAFIENYNGWQQQLRGSAYSRLRYSLDEIIFEVNVRQELIDGNWQPIMPGFGFSYIFSEAVQLKGKVSRNFRYPTLNDLYWFPGGNPDLQPEIGWAQELSFLSEISNWSISTNLGLTLFHKKINNWILWAPLGGGNIWTANNLGAVRSYGGEVRHKSRWEYHNFMFSFSNTLNLTRSQNLQPIERPSIEEGQSLFYVPGYQYSSQLSVRWKSLDLLIGHQWTDGVLGINEDVVPFNTGKLYLGYDGQFKNCDWQVFFKIENLWNRSYQVVEFRPMAGRYFQTGFQLKFNQ